MQRKERIQKTVLREILLVKSIYGRCMENITKRINGKLINNSKDYARYVSKSNFVSQNIFSRDFAAIRQIKSVLTLDKPIYMEFSILELSKLLMHKFHYEYVKNKFEIKEKNVYEKSFQEKEYYDPKNNAVLGKMKDEFKGKIISEFVGL